MKTISTRIAANRLICDIESQIAHMYRNDKLSSDLLDLIIETERYLIATIGEERATWVSRRCTNIALSRVQNRFATRGLSTMEMNADTTDYYALMIDGLDAAYGL